MLWGSNLKKKKVTQKNENWILVSKGVIFGPKKQANKIEFVLSVLGVWREYYMMKSLAEVRSSVGM